MKKILLLILCLNYSFLFAQNVRSGEISYRHIGGNSSFEYEFDLTIYTSQPDTLFIIHWDDGASDLLPAPAPIIVSGNIYQYSIKKNHVFPPGNSGYGISSFSSYRVDSITNFPNVSVDPLSVFAELMIYPDIIPRNSSPVFLYPPVLHATCCNQINFNSAAYDPDGDSLSYRIPFSPPYSLMGASLDSITGDFTFTPPQAGRYYFFIMVFEYRGSATGRIGLITRSILLDVDSTVDIDEINASHTTINIFPNPLISSSTLQLNTQLKYAEVIISDMLGKEMVRKKLTGDRMEIRPGESVLWRIERGSLVSGVYFVRVKGEERQSAGGRIRWGEWVEKVVVE